jgi:DNA primase
MNAEALAILDEGASGERSLKIDGQEVRLTHLEKPFWPELGITKGHLLRYYAQVAPVLLPHLSGRAMVMKRYPHGYSGPFFFMKRAPEPRPAWIHTCSVPHGSGNIIDFPVVDDLASLLWIVNLGCIDLNPWYARRGPTQKQVWTIAKALAQELAVRRPDLITAEYRVAKRPRGRVLVDYNQNAFGRTLASIYSVRPTPQASVSTPVTWEELEAGARIQDFTLANVPERVKRRGDLWKPLLAARGRVNLERFL